MEGGPLMCYLCLRDNPFSSITHPDNVAKKKQRLAEIKKVLKEAEKHPKCGTGDTIVDALRQEQYDLAKEL
jgi:hypothetical protein